jgi:hypothetical protein
MKWKEGNSTRPLSGPRLRWHGLAWPSHRGWEQRHGAVGLGDAMRRKGEGGVRPRPASGAPAGSGPRPAGAAMPRGRCECGWTGETGTDAWAPTTQCRAVATVQFFFKSIQLILNDFKPSKLQPTQKGLSWTQKFWTKIWVWRVWREEQLYP